MNKTLDDDAVLAALGLGSADPKRAARHPLHVAEICHVLEMDSSRMTDVERLLAELADRGLVRPMPGRRWRLSPDALAPRVLVGGVFVGSPRGFGFVTAEDGGDDVYVAPTAIAGAMHGDRVEVRVRDGHRGREGVVDRIVSHGIERVTGVLRHRGRSRWVEPDDGRLRSPMVVAGQVPADARDGDAVLARIVRYPHHADELCEAEVVEALGPPGTPEVEVQKTLLREGVRQTFPDEVVDAARAVPARVLDRELEGRTDLRAVPLVTIDPHDARDHDDAVWAERLADGRYRAIVAIADVSHYVPEGSALDAEAVARGTSIYLPDRAIPMLPPELSSGICSLVDDEDRLSLAVELTLAADGRVEGYRFLEAVIRCAASLSYEQVAAVLSGGAFEADPGAARDFAPLLRTLSDVAALRKALRKKRGSLDFDLPEAKVVLDEDNREAISVVKSRRNPAVHHAYGVVEDFMLLANEVVAAHLVRAGVPTIFRIHPPPNEDRLASFVEVARAFGHSLTVDEATSPRGLSRFLERLHGSPQERVLGYLLLRSLKQATYDTVNVGHFGLAAGDYLHFTSPIRRYPDLCVHRVLRAHLQNRPIDTTALAKQLTAAAAESSRLERRAIDVEREVVALHRTLLMRGMIGEELSGIVVGVSGFGAFVEIEEPYVEVLVRSENLARDELELDDLGIRLAGKRTGVSVALGDELRVRILDANVTRRTVEATLVTPLGEPQRKSQKNKPAKTRAATAKPGTKRKTAPSPQRKKNIRKGH